MEVEVIGAPYDSHNKYKTGVKVDNGLNPVWNETCEFDVINPDVALLRFVVQDEDMFGDPNFLGQANFPVRHMRQGQWDTKKGHWCWQEMLRFESVNIFHTRIYD